MVMFVTLSCEASSAIEVWTTYTMRSMKFSVTEKSNMGEILLSLWVIRYWEKLDKIEEGELYRTKSPASQTADLLLPAIIIWSKVLCVCVPGSSPTRNREAAFENCYEARGPCAQLDWVVSYAFDWSKPVHNWKWKGWTYIRKEEEREAVVTGGETGKLEGYIERVRWTDRVEDLRQWRKVRWGCCKKVYGRGE